MKNKWIPISRSFPKKDGLYLCYAPSADPKKPLIAQSMWSNAKKFYSLVPIWSNAITHWMKVYPPRK